LFYARRCGGRIGEAGDSYPHPTGMDQIHFKHVAISTASSNTTGRYSDPAIYLFSGHFGSRGRSDHCAVGGFIATALLLSREFYLK
jgi:hypothetical protein